MIIIITGATVIRSLILINEIFDLSNIMSESSVGISSVLSWEDIVYKVDTPTQGRLTILTGISGFAAGGRLLAVMGASGSG